MANKKFSSDVTSFWDRIQGQERLKKSDSLIVLNSPETDRERTIKQRIQSISHYVRTKNWNRRHIEFFDEYRRMVATFPIIKAGIDIYAEEMCLSGTTSIPMLNGKTFTIKELYDQKLTNFWLYSFDTDAKKFTPAKAEKVISKGIKNVWEITLDDGSVIKCTDNHKWLTIDNEWKETKDLSIGTSLQSLYTKLNKKGYELIYDGTKKYKGSEKWKKTHSIVANTVLNEEKLKLNKKGKKDIVVCHHASFDKRNNDPKFLTWMYWDDHKNLHNSLNSSRWIDNPDFAARMRKKFSDNAKKMWSNPEWKEKKVKELHQSNQKLYNSLTLEERKEKYGSTGSKNGMFGIHRFGPENPHYNSNLARISFEEYEKLIRKGILTSKISKLFNLSHSDVVKYNKRLKEKYNVKFTDQVFDLELLQQIKSLRQKNSKLTIFECYKIIKPNFERNFSCFRIKSTILRIGYKDLNDYYTNSINNHKIINIKHSGTEEVFDIVNSGKYSNFAIQCNKGMIISHNCCQDSMGNIFSIHSEHKSVKDELEYLFYKVLNINSRGYLIAREMAKFGNAYTYLVTRPKDGVTDLLFLPPEGIIREHMFDPYNLENYRYMWTSHGGSGIFEPWELVHWRNLEDVELEPYGVSILRSIVDTWRRVVLIREALVIYRITRAPSRYLFKIDTSGLTGDEALKFANEMKKSLEKKPLVNPKTGEIDFKWNPLPIASYTPIPLLDGRTITIEELAKEYQEGKVNYVYSVQDETRQIVPGKVKWCGKNYTANKLIRVWLDNESYIDSAPEHPFMLRDGSKKRADELKPFDSLMPFYQDKNTIRKDSKHTYHRTFNPASGKYEFTHRLVSEEIDKSKESYNTVHHKDFNRYNNTPENLQWVDAYEHKKMHGELITRYNKSPEGRVKVTRCNIERKSYLPLLAYHNSPEGKVAQSKVMKSNFEKGIIHNEKWHRNITIKFDNYVWETLNKAVISGEVTGHIKANRFINANLLTHLKTINKRRSLLKRVSANILRRELRAKGFVDFQEYKNSILEPINMILNHKVDRIEVLENVNTDVYCMTVVGLEDQDDRHNFAYLGLDTDNRVTTSGSIIYNSIEENLFMPTYEGSPADVQVLEGASNLDAVEDYKIIKDDLFAGLKIPKSFLSFEEDINSKSTLSEEDIRFAKTIQRLQREIVQGFVHTAIVHLYMKGFSQDELQSFKIVMNNPSGISEKRKNELLQQRLDAAKSAWDPGNEGLNLLSYSETLKTILKLSDEEVKHIIKSQFNEKRIQWRLKQISTAGFYDEPENEKLFAKLKELQGNEKDNPSAMGDLNFDSSMITEVIKKKIDQEISEMFPTVEDKPTKGKIQTLVEGTMMKNIKKAKKDFR